MSTIREIIGIAKEKGIVVSTAESCTGGMVSVAMTDAAGSSAVFERGFVTYSNAAKQELLGVSPATLASHGAVSEMVAREMAEGALRNSGANLSVATTGIAGPGASEFKPEGRVCFATALENGPANCCTVDFGAIGRKNVREAATAYALNLLLERLKG